MNFYGYHPYSKQSSHQRWNPPLPNCSNVYFVYPSHLSMNVFITSCPKNTFVWGGARQGTTYSGLMCLLGWGSTTWATSPTLFALIILEIGSWDGDRVLGFFPGLPRQWSSYFRLATAARMTGGSHHAQLWDGSNKLSCPPLHPSWPWTTILSISVSKYRLTFWWERKEHILKPKSSEEILPCKREENRKEKAENTRTNTNYPQLGLKQLKGVLQDSQVHMEGCVVLAWPGKSSLPESLLLVGDQLPLLHFYSRWQQ
jgi:hypothetical protein